jgi:hypothetical protein
LRDVSIEESDMLGGLFGLLVLGAAVGFYFLPAIVGRDKSNAGAIFALNLLLGWTLVGWVVALVWAMTVDQAAVRAVNTAPTLPPGSFCSLCGHRCQYGARFCDSCGRPMGAIGRGVGA